MADRVYINVHFKKMLWTCPACKQEDVEDRPMEGGASYEHTCSSCAKKFNQSGSNAVSYEGHVRYTPEDYDKKAEEDIAKDKTAEFDKWVYEKKNPPTYTEPSKKDYENMYKERMEDAKHYLEQFAEKATAEELATIKNDTLTSMEAVEKK